MTDLICMPDTAPTPLITTPCEDRDFIEWHQGCPWAAVWVFLADTPQVNKFVEISRKSISSWLLDRYQRQPHITVAYRGLTDTIHTRHVEFNSEKLISDIHILKKLKLQNIELEINGFGSFDTVPYLSIKKTNQLQKIHNNLNKNLSSNQSQYTPHITIGHYSSQCLTSEVIHHLYNHLKINSFRITTNFLHLVRYKTSDIAGSLYVEGQFDFLKSKYYPHKDSLLFNNVGIV